MPKISALPIANSATTGDLLVLDQGNVTKRIDFNVLQSAFANAGTVQSLISQSLVSSLAGGSPTFQHITVTGTAQFGSGVTISGTLSLGTNLPAAVVSTLGLSAGETPINVGPYLNLNVKGLKRSFGAIGDDVADDTTPVTNAFASGKTIEIEDGTYKYSSGGTIFRATDVRGYGPLSVLHYTGAAKALSAIGTGVGDNWKSELRNFRINTTTGTHGLFIKDLGKFEVDDLTINGASTAGIELAGTITTGFCLYVDIHHCTIQNNPGDGLLVNNTGSSEINVIGFRHNLVQGNNGCAMNLKGTSLRAWYIGNNDLEGNGGVASVYLNGGNGVELDANFWEEVVNHPALLVSDTAAATGIKVSGGHMLADVATPTAIVLGVAQFVTGVVIDGVTFLGSYTNAISPAAVIGGKFGPNNCGAGINHVAAPGGSSTGIQVFETSSYRASKIYPGSPAGSLQSTTGFFGGAGLVSNGQGIINDFYFRSDGGLGSSLYKKFASGAVFPLGSWTPII